jgi:hypothetical protein
LALIVSKINGILIPDILVTQSNYVMSAKNAMRYVDENTYAYDQLAPRLRLLMLSSLLASVSSSFSVGMTRFRLAFLTTV